MPLLWVAQRIGHELQKATLTVSAGPQRLDSGMLTDSGKQSWPSSGEALGSLAIEFVHVGNNAARRSADGYSR